MIPLSLGEVAAVTGGTLHDAAGRAPVKAVAADSRTVTPGSLFVALPGERTDGARFAAAALASGAVAVLAPPGAVEGPRVEVDDPLAALGALGAALRARSRARVVAITGSTGKTTTKDLLAAALSSRLRTVASPASFNTEVGLPLTLARLEPDSEALVVEMGARGPGHIAALARMAVPEVGVVLNVGESHIGLFGSRAAIAAAKGELVEALPATGTAVLNADDELVAAMAGRTAAPVLSFGRGDGAAVRAGGVALDRDGRARFDLHTPAGSATVTLPGSGEHLVPNALAAAAAAHVLGVGPADTAAGLAAARLSPMRMQVQRRADGVVVINDAYNANPTSMAAGLQALVATRPPGGRAVAVLGRMAELGEQAPAAHDRLGKLVAHLGVDRLVAVGAFAELVAGAASAGGVRACTVPDAEAAAAALDGELRAGDVVLVKASRAEALERVAERLLAGQGAAGW